MVLLEVTRHKFLAKLHQAYAENLRVEGYQRAIADLRAEWDRISVHPSMPTTFLQGFGSATLHLESKVTPS